LQVTCPSPLSRRRRHARYRAGIARGFTLVEVLLATALAVTLLLALWSLFGIYTSLFTVGQTKTETSQLARALLDQLADDLHSAIQDPIPGTSSKTRTSTPLRRFVLNGSSDQLRLDVLQVTPLQGNPTPLGDSERLAQEPSAARVPELRTVYYTFRDPLVAGGLETGETTATGETGATGATSGMSEVSGTNVENLPGLVRREVDFETPQADESGAGPGYDLAALGTSEGAIAGVPAAGESEALDSLGPQLVDTSLTWVPEVVRLQFRYFDGNGWTSQWNSLTRKSLPVAVEVTLQLGTVAHSAETLDEAEPAEPGGTAGLGEGLDAELASESAGPTYRLVVDVPGSPKHGEPKTPEQEERVVVRRPKPVVRPPVAPRPRPASPPKPKPRPLADEWMRTEP
jgi:type II secretory pathway component PulJ